MKVNDIKIGEPYVVVLAPRHRVVPKRRRCTVIGRDADGFIVTHDVWVPTTNLAWALPGGPSKLETRTVRGVTPQQFVRTGAEQDARAADERERARLAWAPKTAVKTRPVSIVKEVAHAAAR